ncbi:hypothetical protein HBA54_13190 [Pelagibius litoralis]|uniref:Uncharacterized protein n=1 Tax=Pelagibius litoralis TaxID=374515 RepID=A0A967EY45_9PROT|nr:hypothetical protein [Pelagibius litoralis]NIA69550.1 hypothetical protein [Pelagibius litoralis]
MASSRLSLFGYATRFDEQALPNHPSKKAFLEHYQPLHHIRALAAPGAAAVELIDHGALSGSQASGLIPVFTSDAPLKDWTPVPANELPFAQSGLAVLDKAHEGSVRCFFDPVLDMRLLWTKQRTGLPSGIISAVLPVPNVQEMAAILTSLRFVQSPESGIWSCLTPMPSLKVDLVLVEACTAEGWQDTATLDAPGCPCLALMARDTACYGMQESTFSSCERVSFSLMVNNTSCLITLLRLSNGLVLELVEAQK